MAPRSMKRRRDASVADHESQWGIGTKPIGKEIDKRRGSWRGGAMLRVDREGGPLQPGIGPNRLEAARPQVVTDDEGR